MDLEKLLRLPASAVLGFGPFAPVVREYAGEHPGDAPLGEAVPADRREGFLQALGQAAARMEAVNREEIREFGVEADPGDLRYQWGDPDVNERVVRMIEEQYPLPAPGQPGDVVFYGPSNITLWYSLERDMLPYPAQNHGMGGCIDEDMMRYAPRLLYPYRPRAVFFQTGSNDIAGGIPLEVILQNKEKMYRMFLENMPESQLVVCSGLPLPGRTQFWDATVETNRLLEELCARTQRLHFLDATGAMLTSSGPQELRTSDGRYFNPAYFRQDRIHLNKRGHDVWTALMKEKLREIL